MATNREIAETALIKILGDPNDANSTAVMQFNPMWNIIVSQTKEFVEAHRTNNDGKIRFNGRALKNLVSTLLFSSDEEFAAMGKYMQRMLQTDDVIADNERPPAVAKGNEELAETFMHLVTEQIKEGIASSPDERPQIRRN